MDRVAGRGGAGVQTRRAQRPCFSTSVFQNHVSLCCPSQKGAGARALPTPGWTAKTQSGFHAASERRALNDKTVSVNTFCASENISRCLGTEGKT